MATSARPANQTAKMPSEQSGTLRRLPSRSISLALTDMVALAGVVLLSNVVWTEWVGTGGSLAGSLGLSLAFVLVAALALLLVRLRSDGIAESSWLGVVGAVSFASMSCTLAAVVFLSSDGGVGLLAMAWGLAVFLVPAAEALAQRAIKRVSGPHSSVIVVGSPGSVPAALKHLDDNGGRHRFSGIVSIADGPSGEAAYDTTRALGGLESLPEMVSAYRRYNGGVLVAVPADSYSQVQTMVSSELLNGPKVAVALYPGAYSAPDATADRGIHRKRLSWTQEAVKRAVDVTVALVSLIIASPLIALVAVLIKLDSRGPVLFSQVRVGRNGQLFKMHKFRSMRQDAEQLLPELQARNEASGHMFKMADDPRVTRVGRVLRRLSLDELPQLLNVLDGSMSIVGPRPPLPREVEQYEPWHFLRFEAPPGITGLWQVKRGPQISFEEMVRLDLEYIEKWTLKRDLWILAMTVPAMLRGQGAY